VFAKLRNWRIGQPSITLVMVVLTRLSDIFDAEKEAAELKKRRKLKYQQRHGRSRLDRFSGQILGLKNAGSSAVEIQDWLRSNRIKVSLSTITRWIKKHG